MSDSLTSKTLHGLKWSYASTITTSVLQIGYTAVMARLLDPKAFGLVAMGGVILRFGSYFAQMGMGQAVIQKKELTNEDIRAAFTSSIILSMLFLLLVWALAPLSLLIFDDPHVIPIVRVMAVSFVLTGLSTTSLAILRRNLDFKARAVIQIISFTVGYAGVGILLALFRFGVWSLVYASLSQAFLSGVLSYLVVRHDLRLLFNWKYYKPLFAFGSRISGISFLEFIGGSLDTLFVGRFLGAAELGIYNRASAVVNLPMQYASTSVSNVLFPSFSRIQTDNEKLKTVYLNTISLVGLFLFATCLSISVSSGQVVLALLGPKWSAAIPILAILALSTPFDLISHFGGVVCDSTGNLNPKIFLQLSYIIILGVLFYFLGKYGLIGYALALLAAQILRTLAYVAILNPLLHFDVKETVNSYLAPFASGLMVASVIFISKSYLQTVVHSNLILLLSIIAVGAAGLVASLFLRMNFRAREFLYEKVLKTSGLYLRLRKAFA